jgi:cell division protein FtsB
MTDRTLADDTTMKVGLLLESAQVHQKLAEGQLEKLRAHTADLDLVVRDEIRRTLVDELQTLTAETARAARALQKLRSGTAWRAMVLSLSGAMVCSLVPIALARWALPSAAEFATLHARREELTASIAKLEQQGGRIDWRRCGEAKRLCVRVDRKAPSYGETADYYVIEGY